ncbi:MAG: MBL fold metallo-hydrolase [Gemmatimonadetes bacterium]|nr:MBL fold metallo-hydrolase [Gemmatimonadota bacterium]
MFGVVPKPLWERRIAPDERNRIPLALRCLLVEHDDGPVLIDTGLGNKESDKFRDIYGVQNAGRTGPTQLEDALAEAGFRPEEVRWVINTHLHFDHAGGNTFIPLHLPSSPSISHGGRTVGAAPQLSFPNATYVVQQRELEFATHTNERTAASYLEHNFAPVGGAGRWRLANGETELVPGIRLVPTPGHVPFHQSVVIAQGGERACFLGDLVPTTAHLPLPWIMGYDLEPLVTLETKRALLSRAEADGWLLVFEHDPAHPVGRVVREGKSFAFAALDTPSGAG